MAPNPSGKNQHGIKKWPSDEDLRPALQQWAKEQLTIEEKKARFLSLFNMEIGKTTLSGFNKKLNISTPRRAPPADYCAQLIMEEADSDRAGRRGAEVVRTNLRLHSNILIPRSIVRETLAENLPDESAGRMSRPTRVRTPLRAVGPDHQHHSDGWEKLGEQALRLGNKIGIPVYGTKDQWSSLYLQAVVVPNDRLQDAVVHVYLDRVRAQCGIPITEVCDLGSEHGVWRQIQTDLRRRFAPDLNLETAPASLGLSSTKNTPIESGWRSLREYSGFSLAEAITSGAAGFNAQCQLQRCLFYWIWPPIVQAQVDDFVQYWNHHRIPRNKKKYNPSGVTPRHAYEVPHAVRPAGQHCLIAVPAAAVDEIRVGLRWTREQALSFVSHSFSEDAQAVHSALHLPKPTMDNAWEVFAAMLPALLPYYPDRNPEEAFIFTL